MAVLRAVNHGAPTDTDVIIGRYSSWRYFRDLASAAAPVSETQFDSIQDITLGAKAYKNVYELIQYGGGNDILEKKNNGEFTGTIRLLAGEVPNWMAAVLGETWSSAGTAGMPLVMPFYPLVHLEGLLRQDDNATVIHSLVIQDAIIEGPPHPVPDNPGVVDISFKTKYDATIVASGCKVVMDVFTGDASTTTFTPSSTPLTLTDNTMQSRETWDFNTAFFIKERASTAETGTRVKTAVITPATPDFVMTDAPASGTIVSILYVAAV